MSTRSGHNYKPVSDTMAEVAGSIADLMKAVIEDRRSQETQYEEEKRIQREAMEAEKAQMRKQMEMLRTLVESRRADEERAPAIRNTSASDAKLVKLSEQDDIESYLTTFERIMRAYEVKEERWVVKLAPQLTGRHSRPTLL